MAVVLLLLAVSGVHGYKNGAPLGQCDDMTPGHYGATKHVADGNEPFIITTSKTSYAPEEEIEVELKTKAGVAAGTTFKGFMLQARTASNTRTGTFLLAPGSNLQLRACGGAAGTAVTHREELGSTSGIRVTWRAPDGSEGNVTVRATVVVNIRRYYTGIQSAPIYFTQTPAGSDSNTGNGGSGSGFTSGSNSGSTSGGASEEPRHDNTGGDDNTDGNMNGGGTDDDDNGVGVLAVDLTLGFLTLCGALAVRFWTA